MSLMRFTIYNQRGIYSYIDTTKIALHEYCEAAYVSGPSLPSPSDRILLCSLPLVRMVHLAQPRRLSLIRRVVRMRLRWHAMLECCIQLMRRTKMWWLSKLRLWGRPCMLRKTRSEHGRVRCLFWNEIGRQVWVGRPREECFVQDFPLWFHRLITGGLRRIDDFALRIPVLRLPSPFPLRFRRQQFM